jgi:hypothetical protein
METKVLETVLTEVLEEQKLANIRLDELEKKIDQTNGDVTSFKGYLGKVRLSAPPVDTSIIENIWHKHLLEIQREIAIVKSTLDQNRKKENWKRIFWQWLSWMIIVLLCFVIIKILNKN